LFNTIDHQTGVTGLGEVGASLEQDRPKRSNAPCHSLSPTSNQRAAWYWRFELTGYLFEKASYLSPSDF